MDHLTIDELERRSAEWEAAVDRSPGIDPWCSGPDWVIPVHRAFAPKVTPVILHDDHGFAILARYPTAERTGLVAGLEPLWGFACPLVGADPVRLLRSVAAELSREHNWGTFALPGVPPDRELVMSLARELAGFGDVGLQPGIVRRVIDLSAGADAWLSRRRPKFRQNLRNAQRRGRKAGVRFEICDRDTDMFDRVLEIERQSWKGAGHDGITAPEMKHFYHSMSQRLQTSGRSRCVIARIDGRDVGYILGGTRGSRYRGLQLSYARSVAELSLGHLMQSHEIRRMAEEGIVTYDMGMDMAYKERMADAAVASVMLVVNRTTDGEPSVVPDSDVG